VVMGPHTFNFADAAQLAEAQSAARRVPAIGNGVALAVAQAGDVSAHAQASAAALAYAAAHQGASERMAAILLKQARWPG